MSGFGGVVESQKPKAGGNDATNNSSRGGAESGKKAAAPASASSSSSSGILTLCKSLGISGFCRDSVVFSAPTTVAYPLGKQIVFHDTVSGEMRFLARSRTARPVTAMAIDSTLVSLVVCEQSSEDLRAQIHIIHCSMMKKTRTISSHVAGDIVGCAFASSGSRELVTLNFSGEDYTITLWKWAQSKVLASVSTSLNVQAGQSIRRIRFKPNSTMITTSGAKHLRLWTVDLPNSTLRTVPVVPLKREQDSFVEHLWVKSCDCLVVVTAERLLSFKVSDEGTVTEFGSPFEGEFGRIASATVNGSNGFILGGKGGTFSVYEVTSDPAEPFLHLKKFQGASRDSILCMTPAPTHDSVVCYLEGGHLSLFPIKNIDLLKPTEDNFQRLIYDGIHSDAINAMDVCFQRPIVVTAGRDQQINIWDYRKWECVLSDRVTDEPTCIAVHPSGTQLLVGSKERVRFYNILATKLALFVEIPNLKACRQAQFSHGGQYFAVTAGLNIMIYLTYELTCVRTLTGHISPPTSLLWSQDDSLFFSAGADGGVYGWNIEDNVRLEEFDINIVKCDRITGLACSEDKTRLVIIGNDAEVHQVINGKRSDFAVDVVLTRVCIPRSGRCLFVGTEAGTVRVYPWPLPEEGAQRLFELPVHDGPVTHLTMSPDQKYLLSGADDGSVFCFSVERAYSEIGYNHCFNNDTTALLKEDLTETKSKLKALEYEIEEVQSKSVLDSHFLENQMRDKLKEQEEKFARAMEMQKRKHMALEAQLAKHKVQAQDDRSSQDAEHVKLTQKMESEYEHKLGVEMLRFDKLSEDMETLTQRCEEALQKQEDVLRSEITRIKNEHAAVTRRLISEKEELQAKLNETVRMDEEVLRQVRSEYEEEIENIKLETKRQQNDKWEEEALKDKDMLETKNKTKKQKQKISELKHQMAAQENQLSRLEKKNQAKEELLRHRERTIAEMEQSLDEKEREILRLRGNNRKLDNFRYVLDDKIQELQKERGPVNAHIQKLESHIRDMYEELVKEFNDKKHLDRVMNNKMLTIESLTNEVSKLRSDNREKTRTIQSMCHGLTKAIQHAQPRDTVEVVKRLYHNFVRSDGGAGHGKGKAGANVGGSGSPAVGDGVGGEHDDSATVQEALRQRRHMERTTSTLKHALKMKEGQLQKQTKLGLAQNSLLINECNNLRKENKALTADLQKAQERLKVLERAARKKRPQQSGEDDSSAAGKPGDGALAPVLQRGRKGGAKTPAGADSGTPFQRRKQLLGAARGTSLPGGILGGPEKGAFGGAGRVGSAVVPRRGLAQGSTKVFSENALQQAKMSTLLRQLDENTREMDMQRIEIRRLREQVKLLVQQLGPELSDVGMGGGSGGGLQRFAAGPRTSSV